MKRRTALLGTAGLAVKAGLPVKDHFPADLASKLKTLPAGTRQVIVVHAPTAATTSASLDTFVRPSQGWVRAYPTMAARIGSQGFSDHHREGIPTTPTGVYAIGATMYGIRPDPGLRYAYHRIVANDWWNENPDSSAYNTFQHTATNPGGESEALWLQTVAYRYFAFIRYNVPAVPGAGSAIFLHVGTGGPTAGCVSLSEANLLTVLQWLNPAANPRIVLSPDSALSRY